MLKVAQPLLFRKLVLVILIILAVGTLFLNIQYLSNILWTSLTNDGNSKLKINQCPEITPYMEGFVRIITWPIPTLEKLEEKYGWLKSAGHFHPAMCRPRRKLAIIVPYKNRWDQLMLFLQHIHPFLTKQLQDYTIFVVEQHGDGSFNKGILMNAGFLEISKLDDFDCYIFHDVDMLPENDHHIYRCFDTPHHLGVAVDTFGYRLPYSTLFGGVTAFNKKVFIRINGFSNLFWGWGGEDDDMYARIAYHNLYITRSDLKLARYTMIKHEKEKPNPKSMDAIIDDLRAHFSGGLNDVKYIVKEVNETKLFYKISIEFQEPNH